MEVTQSHRGMEAIQKKCRELVEKIIEQIFLEAERRDLTAT